jgi:PAS domain S-box-containing protein
MITDTAAESARNLRQRAEEKLGQIEAKKSQSLSPMETERLLHELQVHQIELEMQKNELRASQDLYHSICDNSLDAILLTAPDGRILTANPAAYKMFERSEDDIKQVGRSGIIDTTDPRLALALAERTLHGQIMAELTCIRKSGVKFPVEITSSVFKEKGGDPRTSLIIRDITKRKQAEAVLLARLYLMQFSNSHTLDELLRATLDEAEALTGSQIGFFHFVKPDQVNLSLRAWSTSTAQLCKVEGSGNHYPVDQAGVWVDCIRERREVIHNDYASHPHRKGLPEGHAQVIRELVVPLLRGDAIVAILGVGNKPTDYNEQDVETITSLADLTWDVVQNKLAEDALKKRMKELSCLYNIMNLFNFPGVTLGEILTEVVLLIPKGFQFPEITEARLLIDGDTYQTSRFLESPWMMTREIIWDDKPVGHLMVSYREERQTEDVGPFLIEEKNLLNAIAEKLGLYFGHKQAETELQESDARFNQLAEQSGTVVWEVDAEGLITYISHVSEAVYGYHPDEVIGKMHFYDLHPESGRDAFKEASLAVFRLKGAFINFENRVQAKDGHIVWVSTTGIPILGDDGILLGYRGSDTDITEKKNVLEQLIQSQKMESIGQLAGGLAHDLNNILTVINGYTTLAIHGINQDQEQLGYMKTILEATSKASSLTHSLLAYSRKQEMNPQNQNLNTLIETIGTFIRRTIHENIEFSFSSGDDPLFANVDALQIEQVLLNFATNARDAMPKGGKFSIATATGSIDEQYISTHGYGTVGDYAIITVSDTGCGMDAETRLKVFDPFFTTKEVGKGTGLGLSMVMGIIKQHGGVIDLQSEPGKGSVFHLYLPLVGAEGVVSAPAKADVLMEKASGTIMIVEDDECTRVMLEDLLIRAGYTVIAAVDGQDAVEKFAARKDDIQLVISDVIMPRKNGREACDEIKLMSGKTKVIYVSGHTYSVIEREGELGADAEVIMKPIMPFELLGRIRELMKAG